MNQQSLETISLLKSLKLWEDFIDTWALHGKSYFELCNMANNEAEHEEVKRILTSYQNTFPTNLKLIIEEFIEYKKLSRKNSNRNIRRMLKRQFKV